MSKIEVNAIEPQTGTTLTLGASGDTITIPAGATISNSGTAAGFGPTGAVSWDTTAKTTGFTAVSGVGYFCNTTSGAFTVTLPATPSAGAVVGLCDYANTFATNNLTVNRNGSKIAGSTNNSVLSTNGISVTFVYVDATQGWIVTDSGNRSDLPQPTFIVATGGTITTCGNYKIHTFTGPGTFTVCSVGNPIGSTTVDYMVVAGGGGGGWDRAGGGGAGGFRESVPSPAAWTASPLANPGGALPVSATGYPITVGAGGNGGTPTLPGPGPGPGTAGSNSVFSTITSAGGGGGEAAPVGTAGAGGSGGGGSAPGSGGAGNTPPVSPPQGNPGGTSPCSSGGGGGGGATGAGLCGSNRTGGAGATTSISGSPIAYAGGGGGGYSDAQGTGTGGAGGTGGGGKGGDRPMTPTNTAVAGTANRGGGGGGGANGPYESPLANGAAGGSGIVIIRYRYQ